MTIELDKGPQVRKKLPAPGKQEPIRDGRGMYRIANKDGKVKSWTRSTTIAGTLEDTLKLHEWEMRLVVDGLMQRPDLQALAIGLDRDVDRNSMDEVVKKSKATAKDDEAANIGTAMHRFTELWDNGADDLEGYPPNARAHLEAYDECIRKSGFDILPEFIETIIFHDEYGYAGQVDRVGVATKQITVKLAGGKTKRLKKGDKVILDLKTGKLEEYKFISFATQLVIYSNHTGTWLVDQAHPDGGTREPPLGVRTDVAAIIHLPATSDNPQCGLHWVDLAVGWEYFEAALTVRDLRSAPNKRRLVTEGFKTKARKVDQPAPKMTADRLRRRCAEIAKRPNAKADLRRRWPASLREPSGALKSLSGDLTADQIEALASVVTAVEADYEIPFTPSEVTK